VSRALPSHPLTPPSPLTPLVSSPSPSLAQVCDKNCEKIHYIAPNIYCCGAGTSADTENTTRVVSSKLDLLRMATGAPSRVVTSMTMLKRYLFRYQGHVSAALVLGGADATGSHLYTVYPHGSTDKLPFVSMGSGSLAAMAVLEAGYKDALTEAEAIKLVASAIRAGIFNDLGSGSNVDLTVIRQKPEAGTPQVTILRNYETPNQVEDVRRTVTRPTGRVVPRGATTVLKETFTKHVTVTEVARPGGSNAGAEGKMEE
jgi:20S proteasome subunit beta 2